MIGAAIVGMHHGLNRENKFASITVLRDMKKLLLLLCLFVFASSGFAMDFKTGEELIAAMRTRYAGKWYKTLTFKQVTTTHKPDGTAEKEVWYEALTAPGQLRIDFDPVEKGNGILFSGGKLYSFKDGKLAGSRSFVHPLLVLGFDVYMQSPETTIGQIKGMGIDVSVIDQDTWQGKAVYIVGAKKGDLKTPQFWIDKKDLLFVRMIQLGGWDKKVVQETQFNKYVKVKGGGWVSAEVKFFDDGRLRTSEDYSEIRVGKKLENALYDPEKWMMVKRDYFK